MNERSHRAELIPGVEGPKRPSLVAEQARLEVSRARHRAAVQDLLDCAVLLVVDAIFLIWSDARLPFIERDGTILVLLLFNSLIVTAYLRSRVIPQWKARRIASTWSLDERARFRAS